MRGGAQLLPLLLPLVLTPAAAMRADLERPRLIGAKAMPPPLRATDGGFTLDSVQRRLPLIVQAVLDNNPSYPPTLCEALQQLGREIADAEPLRLLQASAGQVWAAALEPHISAGDTWFSTPWFVVENYFYKRILELTDGVTDGTDPFAQQKADSLTGAADAFGRMLQLRLGECDTLQPLVSTSLWGNVADLSISAGAKLVAPEAASAGAEDARSAMLLTDDSAALCDALLAAREKQVILVLDNCGLELLSDLLLVDGLLRIVEPESVTLHVKDRPVFVSDVIEADLDITFEWLDANGGGELADRLRKALDEGKMLVAAPEFYTSPLPFWEMPTQLRESLAEAAVVICKGDANYRRLLGDLDWPHDLSFQRLMQEYWPTAVAALRTCKSGVLIGVDPEVEAAAAAALPDAWLTGGKYGMVSFASSP